MYKVGSQLPPAREAVFWELAKLQRPEIVRWVRQVAADTRINRLFIQARNARRTT